MIATLRVLTRGAFVPLLLAAVLAASALTGTADVRAAQPVVARGGYWLVGADGGVFTFGDATFFGPHRNAGTDIVGMAPSPTGAGYWTVDDDGDVYAYGDARWFGSRGFGPDDVIGIAARPQGDGYWIASNTGGVYASGAAPFLGSLGHLRLNEPIVTMAATPSGRGYWLVARDGGVFSFGDAAFWGSTGAIRLNEPIVTMAATPSGRGYWLAARDGGVFSFGDAAFWGSTGAIRLNQPIVTMAATPSGRGYWLVARDGGIFSFGDAQFWGSTGAIRLNQPIVTMAAVHDDGHLGGAGDTTTTTRAQPRPVNHHPAAVDDTASVDEDGHVDVDLLANDSGLADGGISWGVVTPPAHGTTQRAPDGRLRYTPRPDYHGPDLLTYRVVDLHGQADTGTVNVTVRAANDVPQATPAPIEVDYGTGATGRLSATDADGDLLAFQLFAPAGHGEVTVEADGRFTYQPDAGFVGQDTFHFTVRDQESISSPVTVTVTVRGAPVISVESPDDLLELGPRLVFSTVNEEARPPRTLTVRNTGTAPLAIDSVVFSGPAAGLFRLPQGQVARMEIAPSSSVGLRVEFRPVTQDQTESYATLTIRTNDPDQGAFAVALAGFNAVDYENQHEPSLPAITRVLGYGGAIGPLGNTAAASGDEVLSAYWRALDESEPVKVVPLAAFSSRKTWETGITGWHARGTTTRKKLFGIPGGSDPSGGQNQRLLPEYTGATSFRPSGDFGLWTDSSWSDDTLNGTPPTHDLRFWPAIGPDGLQIPGTWVVGWDYHISGRNFDYQDGVYLLKNAVPST